LLFLLRIEDFSKQPFSSLEFPSLTKIIRSVSIPLNKSGSKLIFLKYLSEIPIILLIFIGLFSFSTLINFCKVFFALFKEKE